MWGVSPEDALAGWMLLSEEMRLKNGQEAFKNGRPISVQNMQGTYIDNDGDDIPQKSHTASKVVLGNLSDGDFEERSINALSATTARYQVISCGMAHGPKDTACHARKGCFVYIERHGPSR